MTWILLERLRQLKEDECGVAMLWTLLTSLFFFLLGLSVYAVSEGTRERVMLQNACDSAAYSGAVVQADVLSRIAVLNRAMGWIYMQTNRRQMDYLVEQWASEVATAHDLDSTNVETKNTDTGCGLHVVEGVNHYSSYTGIKSGPYTPYTIKMRGYEEQADAVKSYGHVTSGEIEAGENNMRIIQEELENLRTGLNGWVYAAVKEAAGHYETDGYAVLLGGEVAVTGSVPVADYLVYDGADEASLLAFAGYVASDMKAGAGSWWKLVNDGKIHRRYTGDLRAEWDNHWEKWAYNGVGECEMVGSSTENRVYQYTAGTTSLVGVQFLKLTDGFFGKSGSIVVGMKKSLVNVFDVIFGETESRAGLYDAFTQGGGSGFDLWTLSAARAGVRFAVKGDAAGFYRVQWPGATVEGYGTNGVWNLCVEDWDGVLLPVSRVWSETDTAGWIGGADAGTVTQAVKDILLPQTQWSREGDATQETVLLH